MNEDAGSQTRSRGKRIRTVVTDHPRVSAAVALGTVALAIIGFLWFRPDKLFVNTAVDEALPSSGAAGPSSSSGPGVAAPPEVLSTGSFRSLEHETSGLARIVKLADGRRLVRLENFRTSNGPDVIVILSDTPATENDWGRYDDGEFVAIGALKGNVGNQNFQITSGVDLSRYRSVVIWCRRFNVAFGAAPLEPKG